MGITEHDGIRIADALEQLVALSRDRTPVLDTQVVREFGPAELTEETGASLDIPVRLVRSTSRLPWKAHESDAGYDLACSLGTRDDVIPDDVRKYVVYDHAVVGTAVILPMWRFVRVPTGVKIAIPEGWYGRITGRSSTQLWVKEGIVDSGYRGEILVPVHNTVQDEMVIRDGQRIAQLVLCRTLSANFEAVDALSETERGSGGFGSTGA